MNTVSLVWSPVGPTISLCLLIIPPRGGDPVLFSCSVVSDSAIPWTAACQASLSFTISWSLLKLMSIESVMSSNHFVLCCLLLLLPSVFPIIKVFSNELAPCIRWTKDWSSSIAFCIMVVVLGYTSLAGEGTRFLGSIL